MKNKVKQYTIQEIYDNPKLLLGKFIICFYGKEKEDITYFYKIDDKFFYIYYQSGFRKGVYGVIIQHEINHETINLFMGDGEYKYLIK